MLVNIGSIWVKSLQCSTCLVADIRASDLGLVGTPDDHCVTDFLGSLGGLAFRRTDTETGSVNTATKFVVVETLRGTLAISLDDIDGELTHLSVTFPATAARSTTFA